MDSRETDKVSPKGKNPLRERGLRPPTDHGKMHCARDLVGAFSGPLSTTHPGEKSIPTKTPYLVTQFSGSESLFLKILDQVDSTARSAHFSNRLLHIHLSSSSLKDRMPCRWLRSSSGACQWAWSDPLWNTCSPLIFQIRKAVSVIRIV